MKIFSIALLVLLSMSGVAMANSEPVQEGMFPPHFGSDLLVVAAFALIGIVTIIVGYKLFDRFTPGCNFEQEVQKGNIAAATVMVAVILGLCGIVAAVIHAIVS